MVKSAKFFDKGAFVPELTQREWWRQNAGYVERLNHSERWAIQLYLDEHSSYDSVASHFRVSGERMRQILLAARHKVELLQQAEALVQGYGPGFIGLPELRRRVELLKVILSEAKPPKLPKEPNLATLTGGNADDPRPLREVELPARAYTRLTLANISTIGELLTRTPSELLAMPGFGAASLAETIRALVVDAQDADEREMRSLSRLPGLSDFE